MIDSFSDSRRQCAVCSLQLPLRLPKRSTPPSSLDCFGGKCEWEPCHSLKTRKHSRGQCVVHQWFFVLFCCSLFIVTPKRDKEDPALSFPNDNILTQIVTWNEKGRRSRRRKRKMKGKEKTFWFDIQNSNEHIPSWTSKLSGEPRLIDDDHSTVLRPHSNKVVKDIVKNEQQGLDRWGDDDVDLLYFQSPVIWQASRHRLLPQILYFIAVRAALVTWCILHAQILSLSCYSFEP